MYYDYKQIAMTPQQKAIQIWFFFFNKEIELTGNGDGEHAFQYSMILCDEMLTIHGSSLHQDYWEKVKKELQMF